MDSSGCGCGLMVDSPALCSEYSTSINGEKFPDKVSNVSFQGKMSHEITTRVYLFLYGFKDRSGVYYTRVYCVLNEATE
jgi:hypothetical protein